MFVPPFGLQQRGCHRGAGARPSPASGDPLASPEPAPAPPRGATAPHPVYGLPMNSKTRHHALPSALCYALHTNGALGLTITSPNCPESHTPCATRSRPPCATRSTPPCATRSTSTGRSGLLSQARTAPSPLRLVLRAPHQRGARAYFRLVLRAPHQRGARAYFLKPELPRVPSALCYALQTNGALGLTFSSPNCPESQVKRMRLSPAPSVSKLRISRRAFWSRGVNLT